MKSMAPLPDAVTLDQLRVFLLVAEQGSFSAAARSLRRAQSAVSYAIANLERVLGVLLFEREGRTPSLTEAGRSLLSETRLIHGQVEQLTARARSMAQGVEPQLALAVDVMFPMSALVEAVGAFREEFPAVSLVLHVEALGGIAQLLRSSRTLLSPRLLSVGLALGLVAWGVEGIGLYWICEGLGIDSSLTTATGIYGIAVLAGGAAFFMPGGIGGMEVAMPALLVAQGVPLATAVIAMLLCRLATLWFAVVLGLIAATVLETRKSASPLITP